MIDERYENKPRKSSHTRDLADDRQGKPTDKAKLNTDVCEYSGLFGPEYWSKMKMKVLSPDFVRADFYFFKFLWNGPDASYPEIDAEILEEVLSGVQDIEEFTNDNEYAVFYRLCRPTTKEPMKMEILGVLPFFPANYKAAASLLKPLDCREKVLFSHLCAVRRVMSDRGRAIHPFHIPSAPPSPASWSKCWPGDRRFPVQQHLMQPTSPRGNFWNP